MGHPREYIGCFNDNNGGRDLDGAHIEHLSASGHDAVAECATACQGYTYMGLQWSGECFCGNTYGSQGEAALSECDSDGDVSEGIADMCGVDGQHTCGNHNAVCECTFLRCKSSFHPKSLRLLLCRQSEECARANG